MPTFIDGTTLRTRLVIDENKIRTRLVIGQGPAGPAGPAGLQGPPGIVPGVPGAAYVETTGNNETAELGKLDKPFQTLDAAILAEATEFYFGGGTFNATNAPAEGQYRLFGRGSDQTLVNWQLQNGANGANPGDSGGDVNLNDLTLIGDNSITLNLIGYAGQGSDGANGDGNGDPSNGQNGGNGGSITGAAIISGVVCDISQLARGLAGEGGVGTDGGDNGFPGDAGETTATITAIYSEITGNAGRFPIARRYSTVDGAMLDVGELTNGNSVGSGAIVRTSGGALNSPTISGNTTITGKTNYTGTTNVGLCLNSLTTAQRDAITSVAGDTIRNSTTNRMEHRNASGWVQVLDTTGGQVIQIPTAATVGRTVRVATGQTADCDQWLNAAGTMMTRITAAGLIDTTQPVHTSVGLRLTAFATYVGILNSNRFVFNNTADNGIEAFSLNGTRIFRVSNGGLLVDQPLILINTSVPATATSGGTAGQFARDTNFLYMCVATNTWRRTPLSTW
jgi:hypothetical protein